MFTIESFCNSIWQLSYSKVNQQITKDDYKEFEIPKRNGTRTINYLPKHSGLYQLQQKLLSNFLDKQNLPVCVKGFRKGESYYSFLAEHIGSKFFLRTDIQSFFPSVTEAYIKEELKLLFTYSKNEDIAKILDLVCNVTTLNGALPQGACTSPAMSNLVLARVDQRITKYCQVFHVKYTRYADDMLFSSDNLNFKEKNWFLRKIKYILGSNNLKLNYAKIKYGQDDIKLNGYVISNCGIRLSRKRLSDIRHVISFAGKNKVVLEEFGEEKFLEIANKLPLKQRNLTKYPFKTMFQFSQYLCGYRAYLISMADKNRQGTSFQKELQQIIRGIESQIINYT